MVTRKPSPKELALWQKVTIDAKPLLDDHILAAQEGLELDPPVTKPQKTAKKPAKPARVVPKPIPAVLTLEAAAFPAALDDHGPGRTPGLDRRAALRLQRGQTEIDGRIDLHGMTQDEAHSALNGYLASSYRTGRRCILVITGKGGRENEDADNIYTSRTTGVLRRALPGWLREGANREKVLAFNPAQGRHGGNGAWYVLLRRPRDKTTTEKLKPSGRK